MKYYGWEVIDDPMYHRFLKENIDVTKEDIREMSRVIKKFVLDTTTAVDIGCHYGFLLGSCQNNSKLYTHLISIMISSNVSKRT